VAVKRAASNPVIELLERIGYVARGILYVVMGTLALGLALGVGGKATDQSGSLTTLAGGSFGKIVVIGLAAYSFWGFVRAILDPLHRGDHPAGIAERLGFAWSGVAYGGLAIFALELFAGTGKATAQDSTQASVSRFFAYPAGHWLVIGIGLISIAVGLGQFFLSKKATFKKDMKREEMSPTERKYVDFLGRFGYFARGVTFTLVGWFVLQAGLHRDPSQVKGFGGAFVFLLNQPYGHLLLAVVALGFIALGLHSFACARWMRLLGSSS
jgi:fumarate reductase subunit D